MRYPTPQTGTVPNLEFTHRFCAAFVAVYGATLECFAQCENLEFNTNLIAQIAPHKSNLVSVFPPENWNSDADLRASVRLP